jgi:hypothetical protein
VVKDDRKRDKPGCSIVYVMEDGIYLGSIPIPKAPDLHNKGKKQGVSYNKYVSNKVVAR